MFNFNQRKCPDANYTVHKSVCEKKYCGETSKTCKFNPDTYRSGATLIGAVLALVILIPIYFSIATAFANMM